MEESSLGSEVQPAKDDNLPSSNDGTVSNSVNGQDDESKSNMYFIAKVTSYFTVSD